MRGDVLTRHPEVVERIPDDVTVLDWNYDSSWGDNGHWQVPAISYPGHPSDVYTA